MVRGVRRIYLPVLRWAVAHGKTVVFSAALILAMAAALFPFLGTEFIPTMDEGMLTPQVIRLPSVSLSESIEIEKRTQQALLKFPERSEEHKSELKSRL